MFSDIAWLAFTTLIGSVIGHVLLIWLRNRAAYRTFKLQATGLPILPEPKPFSGHMHSIYTGPENHLAVDSLHARYGKTFGYLYRGDPAVSTTDLDLIATFSLQEPNAHTGRFNYDIPIPEFEEDNVLFANGDQWRRIRKAVAPAFSTHRIKTAGVKAEVQSVVNKFVAAIETRLAHAQQQTGAQHVLEDCEDLFQRFSFDLVFTCFYKQTNLIDYYAPNDHYVNLLDQAARDIYHPIFLFSMVFPAAKRLLIWLLDMMHPMGEMRREFMGFILSQRKQHSEVKRLAKTADDQQITLADGTKFQHNMFDYITKQLDAGEITEREYNHTAFVLIFAAGRTPADALSKLIYLLAKHPEVQSKLRESVLADGVESRYLHWCVLEAIRLYPPVHSGSSRVAGRDLASEAGLVPKGTNMTTPAYTIHRLKDYWGSDARLFRPERWQHAKDFHPVQFLGFGSGRRICPGKDFALQSIKALMNELMSRYKFEACPQTPETPRFTTPLFVFVVPDGPTMVQISRA